MDGYDALHVKKKHQRCFIQMQKFEQTCQDFVPEMTQANTTGINVNETQDKQSALRTNL